ncbi:MAG: divergent polysaccharide deacetylase family protein [Gammaproteobacteria bacterium]|nr:divergent polysaccharide deacetylase family protein [Gammaproteobacteria bacterium]
MISTKTSRLAGSAKSLIRCAVFLLLPATVHAQAVLSIVIDDLGNNLSAGRHAIALSGEFTLAVLPHTAHGVELAEIAHAAGKEVLVHVPMEPFARIAMGPGGLSTTLPEKQFKRQVHRNLDAIPFASGFNNHMGSRLTTLSEPMHWLMEAVTTRLQPLFVLDSKTSPRSLLGHIAQEHKVASISRDVFLDSNRTRRAIYEALDQVENLSRRRGYALAIGHPYPETLEALSQWRIGLESRGVTLVRASHLLAAQRLALGRRGPTHPARKPTSLLVAEQHACQDHQTGDRECPNEHRVTKQKRTFVKPLAQ